MQLDKHGNPCVPNLPKGFHTESDSIDLDDMECIVDDTQLGFTGVEHGSQVRQTHRMEIISTGKAWNCMI